MKAMLRNEIENLVKRVNSEIGSDYVCYNPSLFYFSKLRIESGNGVAIELHTSDANFLNGFYNESINDLQYYLVSEYKKAERERGKASVKREKKLAREQDVINELADGEFAIKYYQVAKETDKAILVKIFKGDKGVWLPKLQVRIIGDDYMAVANWLSNKFCVIDIIEKH